MVFLFCFNAKIEAKCGVGLLHPCFLLTLFSSMFLSLFSLLGIGLVIY